MVNIVKWRLNWMAWLISACKENEEFEEFEEFQIPLQGGKKEYGKL